MSKFFIINSETISEFLPIGAPVVFSTIGANMGSVENDDVLIGYNNSEQKFHCHYKAVKDGTSVKLVKQLDKVQGVDLKDIPEFPSKYLCSIMSPISICEIDESLGMKLLKGLYSARCPIDTSNKNTTLLDYYKLLSVEERINLYKNYCVSKRYRDNLSSILTTDNNGKKQHSRDLADCVAGVSEKRNIFEIDRESVVFQIYNEVVQSDWNDKRTSKKAGAGNGEASTAVGRYKDFLKELNDSSIRFKHIKTLQQIIFGAPGTGKSYSINQTIGDNVKVDIFGVEAGLPKEKDGDKYIIPDKMIFRTTFHPEYDYAQFVGCYKPIVADEDGKDVTYQFVPQVFTDAYVEAWNNPDKPVSLVIEEINRGNCAQIFGDIFQLLDRNKEGFSEYSIQPDKDLQKYLSGKLTIDDPNVKENIRNGEALLLPKNFNILATMNTSDQSLYPMDSAFKRRWNWKYTPTISDDPTCKSNKFIIYLDNEKSAYCNWLDFVKKVNTRIKDATKSEDKQLGEFFIKGDVTIDEFISKVMFYLWTDICKENYTTKDNFFRTEENGPDKNSNEEFTFNELVSEREKDGETPCPKDKRLQQFMKYLDVEVKK